MKRTGKFQLGIETLLADGKKLLRGKRVGLLAHPASVDMRGCHSSVLLREFCGDKLVALFGPEHGFFGRGGAGEKIGDEKHPAWGIPIHSLYGEHRRPTEEMLRDIDVLVFDLQDIGVRCYTFVSTLRYVMEECARLGKTLIVCDRPIPHAQLCDGPMPDGRHNSFVCDVPAPLVHGMTPCEMAMWLYHKLPMEGLDLHVQTMLGFDRTIVQGQIRQVWISPSPGIHYWETAWYYPATVMYEALPAIDYGRGGTEPFQVITAPFINAEKFAKRLNKLKLSGVIFTPYWNKFPGIRFQRVDAKFWPFTAGLWVLDELQRTYGRERIWDHPGTREDFFDKLMGTDSIRRFLKEGSTPLVLSDLDADKEALFNFKQEAYSMRLYQETTES